MVAPYAIWILVFIKLVYFNTTSNTTCCSVTATIMSDNETQELLQQLLVKSDAFDTKLINIEESLQFEITEIEKNFETFQAKNLKS